MFGLFKKKGKPPESDASKIVPRIKHTNFLETISGARINGRSFNPEEMPVTESLVGDLLVTYAFDFEDMFQMFTIRDLNKLGMTIDQVRPIAIQNLRKQIAEFQIQDEPPLLIPTTGNDLEACLLLLDEVLDSFATQLPGEIVVGVPTRDAIFVTSSQSDPGLFLARELVTEGWKQETTHRLTQHLLVRRDNKWDVFKS